MYSRVWLIEGYGLEQRVINIVGHDLVEGHKYRHIYYERVQGVGSFVDLAISGWPAPRA